VVNRQELKHGAKVSRYGLKFDLLREHFAIQGDTATEGDGRKMGAPCAFSPPKRVQWKIFAKPGREIEKRVVGPDNLKRKIFRAIRDNSKICTTRA